MANSKIFHFFACFKAKSVLWDNDYVILKDIAKIQQEYSNFWILGNINNIVKS